MTYYKDRQPMLLDEGGLSRALKDKGVRRRRQEELNQSHDDPVSMQILSPNSRKTVYTLNGDKIRSKPGDGLVLLDEDGLQRALKKKAERRRAADDSAQRRRRARESMNRLIEDPDLAMSTPAKTKWESTGKKPPHYGVRVLPDIPKNAILKSNLTKLPTSRDASSGGKQSPIGKKKSAVVEIIPPRNDLDITVTEESTLKTNESISLKLGARPPTKARDRSDKPSQKLNTNNGTKSKAMPGKPPSSPKSVSSRVQKSTLSPRSPSQRRQNDNKEKRQIQPRSTTQPAASIPKKQTHQSSIVSASQQNAIDTQPKQSPRKKKQKPGKAVTSPRSKPKPKVPDSIPSPQKQHKSRNKHLQTPSNAPPAKALVVPKIINSGKEAKNQRNDVDLTGQSTLRSVSKLEDSSDINATSHHTQSVPRSNRSQLSMVPSSYHTQRSIQERTQPVSWSIRNERSTGFRPNQYITKETMTHYTNNLGGVETVAATTKIFYDRAKHDPELKKFFQGTRWEHVRNEFIILANLEVPEKFEESIKKVLEHHCRLLENGANLERLVETWESAIESSWLEHHMDNARQLIVGPSRVIFNLRALERHYAMYQKAQRAAERAGDDGANSSRSNQTSPVARQRRGGLFSRWRQHGR